MKNMIESITVRRAKATDVSSISELLFRLKSIYGSCKEKNVQSFLKHYSSSIEMAIKSKVNIVYVAEHRNKIIGFISFTTKLVIRLAGKIGVLEEVYIKPQYRKKGVGLKLWKYSTIYLKKHGIENIEVVSSLAHPGQRQWSKKINLEWYSNIHRVKI